MLLFTLSSRAGRSLLRLSSMLAAFGAIVGFGVFVAPCVAQNAQPPATAPAQPAVTPPGATTPAAVPAAQPKKTQAELEADLAKLLNGATLEGSFTMTGRGGDSARLNSDKYTLGEVRKLSGNTWVIQARMQNAMIPLPLPIEWAGDTPVIIVDNFTIPGMGTFSARVMFFADHYAGYWKHDERGGSMFGVVHRANAEAKESKNAQESKADGAKESK